MASTLQRIFNERASSVLKVSPNHHNHNYGTRRALERIAMSLEEIDPTSVPEERAITNGQHKLSEGGGSSEGEQSDTSYEKEEEEQEEDEVYEEEEELEEQEIEKQEVMEPLVYEERMTRSKLRNMVHEKNEGRAEVKKRKRLKRKKVSGVVGQKRQRMMTRSRSSKRSCVLSYERLPMGYEEDEEEEGFSSSDSEPLVVTRTGRISHPRMKLL